MLMQVGDASGMCHDERFKMVICSEHGVSEAGGRQNIDEDLCM